jgi:hypothetical protein
MARALGITAPGGWGFRALVKAPVPHPNPSLAAQYHPPITVQPKRLPRLPFQLDRLGWPPQTLLRHNPHRLGTVRPGHRPIKGPQNPGAEAPGAGLVAARLGNRLRAFKPTPTRAQRT